jgi:putative membrane protein
MRFEGMTDQPDNKVSQMDLAEDRTILSNERTFAGWVRTSLGSIAIGLGFRGLFWQFEPEWIPRSIATGFLLLAIAIVWLAVRRSSAVTRRLSSHVVETAQPVNLVLMATAITVGAGVLGVAIWLI